jgi:hypothetical protein
MREGEPKIGIGWRPFAACVIIAIEFLTTGDYPRAVAAAPAEIA